MKYNNLRDFQHEAAARKKALRVANWYRQFYSRYGAPPESVARLVEFGKEEARSTAWWNTYLKIAQQLGYITRGPIRKTRPGLMPGIREDAPSPAQIEWDYQQRGIVLDEAPCDFCQPQDPNHEGFVAVDDKTHVRYQVTGVSLDDETLLKVEAAITDVISKRNKKECI